MNNRIYIGLLIALPLACFGAWSYVAQATQQVAGKDVMVGQNQTVEDDLILAGQKVQVQCEARQDLLVAGDEVTISGPVKGYILAAGNNVTLSGAIGNDLFAAAAKLRLNAPVADNAVLAGGEVYLQPGAEIHHDALLAGGKVEVAGKVARDLKLVAGEAQLASEVGGSVVARVGQLKLLPTAVVRGDLKVYSPKPPDISSQAQVLGRMEYIRVEEEHWAASWLKRWLYSFLALSVVGLVALGLFPWWANRVAGMFARQPGATLLSGLGGLILIPLIVLLLLASVIGIPLAFIVLALFVIALLLSGVFVSWMVGGWLCEQFRQPQAARWWRMLLGAFVVSLLVALPVLGILSGLLVMLVGLGALLLERRETWEQVRIERAHAIS